MDSIKVQEEIDSLGYIWPDKIYSHQNSDGSTTLELPVPLDLGGTLNATVHNSNVDTVQLCLHHLPPIFIRFCFPSNYPSSSGPSVSLNSVFSLSENATTWLTNLVVSCEDFWVPNEQSAYFMIDHVHDILTAPSASNTKPLDLYPNKCNNSIDLQTLLATYAIPPDASLSILLERYNACILKEKFNDESFPCGICLEEIKGLGCLELDLCKHVYGFSFCFGLKCLL